MSAPHPPTPRKTAMPLDGHGRPCVTAFGAPRDLAHAACVKLEGAA